MLRFFFWYVTLHKCVITWIGHMQTPKPLAMLKDLDMVHLHSLPALCFVSHPDPHPHQPLRHTVLSSF